MYEVFGLVVGHLVGDFMLQTDYQARNKQADPVTCAMHVLWYTLCVMCFSAWITAVPFDCTVLALSISVPHFLIDHFNLAQRFIDSYRPGLNRFCWSRIVVDFTMHMVCLYLACILRASLGA